MSGPSERDLARTPAAVSLPARFGSRDHHFVSGAVGSFLLLLTARGQCVEADARRDTAPTPVVAEPWLAPREFPIPRAPFQTDFYRFGSLWIVPRTAVDLLAMPLSILGWGGEDWALFGVFGGATLALMLPTDPALDVRFQRWVQSGRNQTLDAIFPRIDTGVATIAGFSYVALLWGIAAVAQQEDVTQLASLSTEAIALTQVYHLASKALLGRESPTQGDGLGIIHGPTVDFFPGGTPSGHAATVTAALAVYAEYFDSWWLRGVALAAGTYVSVSLVYRNQHFLSDVIWGGAMGYAVGAWVVHHRSNKYTYDVTDGAPLRVAVLPLSIPGGGGLSVSGQW